MICADGGDGLPATQTPEDLLHSFGLSDGRSP